MNEEYETLMRFHLLLCKEDISKYRYAAVDGDGLLVCFILSPVIPPIKECNCWNSSTSSGDNSDGGGYIELTKIAIPKDWKLTVIKL